MPLHDWGKEKGWDGVQHVWITEVFRWLRPRLPFPYRALIGMAPTITVGAGERPDVSVHLPSPPVPTGPAPISQGTATLDEPDAEMVASPLHLDPAVFVTEGSQLVAAVELISPRNKDRPSSRATYLARYAGYLLRGAHLLLVDVHPRPAGFSFADGIAEELQISVPPCQAPFAAAYRVGEEAATGGHFVALWQRPLQVGAPLPTLPLPLTVHEAVAVDLEQTYTRAATDLYLP